MSAQSRILRRPPTPDRFNSIGRPANAIVTILLGLYAALCIVPFFLVIAVSLSNERDVLVEGYRLIPRRFDLSAYEYLWLRRDAIGRAYGVSILVTAIGGVASVFICAMAAYPLARPNFGPRRVVAFLVFFTLLFNGGLVPWYMVYTRMLSLKNTLWVLIIPYLVNPFYILIIRAFYRSSIPEALFDAATIDGAGQFFIFFRVVLPLSTPVLATVGLFNTLQYWNDWYLGLVFITDEKWVPLQYFMYKVQLAVQYLAQQTSAAAGTAGDSLASLPSATTRMAMAVVGIGPIVLAYPFFQRYFVKGLVIGAIKG